MKSKKSNSNKTGWNPYDKNIGHSNPIPQKDNPSVSRSTRESVSDSSMAVNSPAMNTSTNPVNSGALRVSPPSPSSSSPAATPTCRCLKAKAWLTAPNQIWILRLFHTTTTSRLTQISGTVFSLQPLYLELRNFSAVMLKTSHALFLRIGTFIQQCSLGDKPIKDFPELADIGVAAWHLINTIYELGWDRLIADNNMSFCQCVSSRFVRNSIIVHNVPKSNPPIDPVTSNKSKSTKPTYKEVICTGFKD